MYHSFTYNEIYVSFNYMKNKDYISLDIDKTYGIGLPSKIIPEMLPEILHSENPIELQEARYSGQNGKWTSYSYKSEVNLTFDTSHFSSPLVGKFHKHDYFEIILNLSNDFEMQVEGTLYELKNGDVCLLNRSARHAEHFKGKEDLVYFVLSEDYVRNRLIKNQASEYLSRKLYDFFEKGLRDNYLNSMDCIFCKRIESKLSIIEIIQLIKKEFIKKEPGYKTVVDGLMIRFLCTVVNSDMYEVSNIDLISENGFALAQSAKTILDKAKRKLSIKEISAKLGYNGNYINRVFEQYYGYSLSKYNQRKCVEQAEHLLLTTSMSVHEICTSIGYSNRTSFYKLFHEKNHCSPADYRRNNNA